MLKDAPLSAVVNCIDEACTSSLPTTSSASDGSHPVMNEDVLDLHDDERLNPKNQPSFVSLERFFREQLRIDQLQTKFMKEYYLSCYKLHLEKKTERKRRTNQVVDFDGLQEDFQTFLEIVNECAEKQAELPKREDDRSYLEIGERGWYIIHHWICPIFKMKKKDRIPELECDTCKKHFATLTENNVWEEFLRERNNFKPSLHMEPLSLFEKFIDIFTQRPTSNYTHYDLGGHASTEIFARGIAKSTAMTHVVLTPSLQGGDAKNNPHSFNALLRGIEENTSIFSIDLAGITIENDSTAKAICKMIANKKNLQRVAVSGVDVRKEEYTTRLLNAIYSSSAIQIEIYLYSELDSNFRFLENASNETRKALTRLLTSPTLRRISILSTDHTLNVDFIGILSDILDNKFLYYFQFSIEEPEEKSESYSTLTNSIQDTFLNRDVFYFRDFHTNPLEPHVVYHVFKHCRKQLQQCSLTSKMVRFFAQQQYFEFPKKCYLKAKCFQFIESSFNTSVYSKIKKLTLQLPTIDDSNVVTTASMIMEATCLEKVILHGLEEVNETQARLFAQTCESKKREDSRIRKVILYDIPGEKLQLFIPTLLNLEVFPKLTALYFTNSITDQQYNLDLIQTLTNSIALQEKYYPKGLKKLALPSESITKSEHTDYLLQSLMKNKVLESLSIFNAPLTSLDTFVDFFITNKTVSEIKLNYSSCKEIPKELLCTEDFTPEFCRVFGAMQLNWALVAIDWYVEYYWYDFILGSRNYVGERFLVERIMARNKQQVIINKYMTKVLGSIFSDSSTKYLFDIVIVTHGHQ
ncbi:hypothetical protein C9374_004862 [Naegleria lovaniensis]|uniref:Uncharacterized protein n=1 Tax=Naegleria lovaniensis TaxID=51637 RepID=A0AA88KKT2_NAELO|nr:uncharacterized protein C9374_004862 [Naegleria lovaniensis]KAG2382895.1 hypothetical protein C9374_004862 [Naegleria lovaniensis]